MDWFKIGKGVCQGCILSPCLFNLYAEYIMWNARLDKSQAGIKVPGRNINNFRYADDTTLMAESKEELKSLLMKVKEESEKTVLKLNIQKTKIKLKLMSIESVMPSNHLILCHPLLLLPSIFPSTRVFSSEMACRIRWPKYWSFSFSPSNQYSGLISNLSIRIRIDWFDLLAGSMQGCHLCGYWFVKNPVSIKCSKATCDKMKYACTSYDISQKPKEKLAVSLPEYGLSRVEDRILSWVG